MEKGVTPRHPFPFLLVILIFVGYLCQPCPSQALWLKFISSLALGEGHLIQTSETSFWPQIFGDKV